MLTKKFYIFVSVVVLVICAISFLSLRSNVPDEPIKSYKVITPTNLRDSPSEKSTSASVLQSINEAPNLTTDAEVRDSKVDEGYTSREQQIAQLQAQVAELERIVAENDSVIAEKRAIIKEVEDFDEWLSNIDMLDRFSDLFDLLSLSDEEIRETFSAEEFKSFMTEKISLFNAIREDFLNRIETCSPCAREIIYARINATPELKRIYHEYIEKPLAPVGGLQ